MAKKTKKRVAARKRKTTAVARLQRGAVRVRVPADATPQDREEAAQFAQTLERNQQIAPGNALTPGATHKIEKDAAQHDTLVRKRFSSI